MWSSIIGGFIDNLGNFSLTILGIFVEKSILGYLIYESIQ